MDTARVAPEELPAPVTTWVNRNTLFGSLRFARLWEVIGGRVVFWTVSSSETITAVLPGVEFGGGKLTRFQSMPDGLYAPLMSPSGRPAEEGSSDALVAALERAGYLKIVVNDFVGRAAQPDGFRRVEGETILVDLSGGDWQPPDGKLRSEIRKAEREHVRVVDFSLNRHLDNFLDLVKRTAGRHDRQPKYRPEFYHELARLAMIEERIRWLVCEHEGEIAASHIYLLEGDQILYWQAHFDKNFSFLKPNQYMTFRVAEELRTRGFSTLNLGASPPEAEGLADYKMKWGGRIFNYPIWERRSLLGRMLP